jgi:WD40 repeat protein
VTSGSDLSLATGTANPYPGLRPFHDDEAEVFFGREAQTDQLLEKLQRSHFIAVVGPSGCGKSSLVRAGMIAALESGFLADTGTGWRIAEMRPGDRPMARLADALLAPSALGAERGTDASEVAIVRAMLRRGPLGILEILGETPLPKGSNLLILVDQFEEIFRFRKQGSADEADAFVALLLATVARHDAPVYVVITMRSDFLGECALFAGLPEAINDGQYLTPRLTRDQIRAAITGPARVFDGEVEPALVNHLLNEIGPDPDQLPLLQHAMMRMWASVQNRSGQRSAVVTMADYEAIGTLSEALSRHADQELASLTERQQQIARVMLTRLTERSADKADTRRPTRLDDVAAVAGATEQEVIAVVEPLRRQGCSFLTPPPPVPLRSSTVLDIGHESLIRQWRRLYEWVDAEATAASRYRRLAERAELHAKGETGLMADRELAVTLEWHEEWRPTAVWAKRYHPGFEAAETFLAESRAARDAATRAKARSRFWRSAAAAASGLLVLGMIGLWVRGKEKGADAEKAKLAAAQYSALAKTNQALAHTANAGWANAERERGRAEQEKRDADRARSKVEDQNRILKSQKLAGDAADQLKVDPDSALSLALGAFRLDSTHDAKGLLQRALLAGRLRSQTEVGKLRPFWSQDGRFVAVADSQGSFQVWETTTGQPVAATLPLEGRFVRGFFSPHGDILGVLSDPGRIALWNTRTWRPLSVLQGPLSARQLPSVSWDSRLVIAMDSAQHPRIWETATGKEVGRLGADTGHITMASFSPDGKYIVTTDSIRHRASLWSAGPREYLDSLPAGANRPILAARFSPDSRHVLLTPLDNRFTPTLLAVDHSEKGGDLPGDTLRTRLVGPSLLPAATFPPLATFSPDGRSILAVSGDLIRVWRAPFHSDPITLRGTGGGIRSARFSQDGRLILSTGGDGTAKLWDIASGGVLGSFPPGSSSGKAISGAWLSPDSRQLLTTSEDGILRVWSTVELGTRVTLAGLPDSDANPLMFDLEFPAAITPNGKYLLARATDHTARIWEVSTGAVIAQLGDAADRAGLSPDGKRAITSTDGGMARVWDAETGKSVGVLEHDVSGDSLVLGSFGDAAHPWTWYRSDSQTSIAVWNLKNAPTPFASVPIKGSPGCVTVSPDAKWMVTCEADGGEAARIVRVRQLPSGKEQAPLRGHSGTIIDVFFSGDGRFAASTGYDKTAMIWRVGSWLAVDTLRHQAGVQYAAFSPDSRVVATIDGDYTVRVWDTETGGPISELVGHTDAVKAYAFSGDGRWLVTGSEDNTARIWDPSTGQAVAVLYGHTGPVIAVAFVQGSRAVVTAGADGTIRTYPCELCVLTPQLVSVAEQRLKAIRRAEPAVPSGKVAPK